MLLDINTDFYGQGLVQPRDVRVLTDAARSAVITAGFLTSEGFLQFYDTDFATVIYAYDSTTGAGTLEQFTMSVTNDVPTLVPFVPTGDVLLPVVSGDVAVFNGTTGQIKDSGASLSNAAKTKIVMANAASVVGQIPKYTDTAGTIGTIGASVIAATTATYGGGGTSNAFTATGLTAASIVTANIVASTNSVSITKVLPGTNLLTITFSADPGAATTVNYHAYSGAAS